MKFRTNGVTQELLKERLIYSPNSGKFYWKVDRGVMKAGEEAGCKLHGYLIIGIGGSQIPAHRLAWLYMMGSFPDGMIDHINGDRQDNRWINLRAADASINQQNLRRPKGKKTGFLGVWQRNRKSGRFQAEIRDPKTMKKIRLGAFATAEEAHQAYLSAKRKLHPGCTI